MNNSTLYILCGIPFSGKSTLAQQLVDKRGLVRIDLDEVKFEMFGNAIREEAIDQTGWDNIYQEMYKRIGKNLQQGKDVLNDTGNFTKHERDLVREVAEKVGSPTKVIFVSISEEIARKRWLENKTTKKRFDISQASFEEAVGEMEPPSVDENVIYYTPGTNFEEWVTKHFSEEEIRYKL